MTCHDVRERLSALADELLTPAERAACQAHLATCPDCAREWDRFRATLGLLHRVAPARAPAGFIDRVRTAVRPAPWWRRLVRSLFVPWPVKLPLEAAAAGLVAVLAILVVQQTPEVRRTAREQAVPPRPPGAAAPVESPAGPVAKAPAAPEDESPRPQTAVPPQRATAEERTEAFVQSPPAQRSVAASPWRISDSGPRPPERADQPAVERRQAAEPRGARAMVSPSSTAALVSGDLVVTDRETAARALADLMARVGGVERGRHAVGDTLVMEVELAAPGTYPAFAEGLAGIGAWRPDRVPDGSIAGLRVVLRVTARER